MKEQNLQSLYRHRHEGAPIAIGMKVETKHLESLPAIAQASEGSEFSIELRSV